jgi:serine/threonine protein kinase
MDALKKIIAKIDTRHSNLNGTHNSFDRLAIKDVFNLSESKLNEIITKFSLSDFELPKTMGYNSLVIYTNSNIDGIIHKLAIKISLISKYEQSTLDSIHKLVSDNNISPKIFYDCIIDFNSRHYIIKLIINERVIPFIDFEWISISQMKNSIITLINKTLLLHSMGYVHNDIKYENLGLDEKGNIYIFDFDNFTKITKLACSKKYSSSVCHPPENLINFSISHGLGNCIIDLFSIVTIILGDIIKIRSWHFDNEQLYEKKVEITYFNRGKIHNLIQNIISQKFSTTCCSQFWYSLMNFVHLVFQKNIKIINKRGFTVRSRKLIKRMKSDL